MAGKVAAKPNVQQTNEDFALVRGVLDASTEYSIISMDVDGTIVFWNEGARRLYGYEAREVIGRLNVSELCSADDVKMGLPQSVLEAARAAGKWDGMLLRRRKNGDQFTASVVVTPRMEDDGTHVGILLISRNVSDEIRATEQLKSTQFYTRSLIESNIDALMTTDPLGIITDVNEQMESLTGNSRDELIGSPFKNYFTNPQAAEEGIRLVLREGKVTNYELTARAKDGTENVVSYNATTFNDRDGKLQGVFAAARDVTERKRFEETLQEKNYELGSANMAKDHFLANMSHELRTPLNAIIGFTGTLLMKLPGTINADQEKQLKTIQTSAKYLLSLINDLLDLAKIESGKVTIKLESVELRKVVDEVVTALSPMAAAKGLAFEVKSFKPDLAVKTDQRALTQILLNLTNNAIKFTDRGQVTLEVRQSSGQGHTKTQIRVVDTGIGIRDIDQSKLFQAFEQVGTPSVRRHEGTRLGLHLSQKLAEILGGHIELYSEFGRGSTFTLVIEER